MPSMATWRASSSVIVKEFYAQCGQRSRVDWLRLIEAVIENWSATREKACAGWAKAQRLHCENQTPQPYFSACSNVRCISSCNMSFKTEHATVFLPGSAISAGP